VAKLLEKCLQVDDELRPKAKEAEEIMTQVRNSIGQEKV
jgi:hypothetical protein